MKQILMLMVMLLGILIGVTYAQGTSNVPLLAHINAYPSNGYNDCWGYTDSSGREYALLGVRNGTSILDITDTDNVLEVAFIPSANSTWKDIKTYQHYAYVVTEATGGLQIIDLSGLPLTATLANTTSDFSSSHNIFIDVPNAILYIEGNPSEPVMVYRLADPLNPEKISSFGIQCHDIFARDNIAYVSEGSNGSVGIYDLNDPYQPELVQRLSIPGAGYVHNTWLTDDGQYMMTTEETPGKTIKLWNISDLNNITLTDEILAPGGLAHNVHIKGVFAYVSHYSDGLRIYDINDPFAIFEAGYYDTVDDWGVYPFFNSGKVLISDIQNGLYVVYFEGAREKEPSDPNPPSGFTVYSDYHSPDAIYLSWTDPTTTVNGDTLRVDDFVIEIYQGDEAPVEVPGGEQYFQAEGLTEGILYEFEMFTRLLSNDRVSIPVTARWFAGGSPVPAPPDSLAVQAGPVEVSLTWQDPQSQEDGTPLDDLFELEIYRDGELIGSVAPGTEYYLDQPPQGNIYTYTLKSIDSETPPNRSIFSNSVTTFVGDIPEILVWVGQDVSGEGKNSGDSLFSAIANNGYSVFLTHNLFEFGNNLGEFRAIFVVLGIFSNNHVLTDGGSESLALDKYLKNGGSLYVEGGDCFNYDPDNGGFNIRPWFDLNPGPDGINDIYSISGHNALSTFSFTYTGINSWMDELQPVNSDPIWINQDNGNILGVYCESYGNGLSIGVVPSFAGFEINDAITPVPIQDSGRIKLSVSKPETGPFIKRYAHFPHHSGMKINNSSPQMDGNGLFRITAGSKAEIMAAYMQLLGVTTLTLETDPSGLAIQFDLFQNYPNPFNPITTISYQLPAASLVKLQIYNSLGQRVKTLVSAVQSSGIYSRVWDGRSDAGAAVASGVYLYRLEAGEINRTRKMLLVR